MSQPLPRFTDTIIVTDPLTIALQAKAARDEAVRQRIHRRAPVGNPATLRGIPALAPGVGGASPGTKPEAALLRSIERAQRSPSD